MPLPPHGGLPAIAPPQPATGLVRPIVFFLKKCWFNFFKKYEFNFFYINVWLNFF
jgi:hypothetical protein